MMEAALRYSTPLRTPTFLTILLNQDARIVSATFEFVPLLAQTVGTVLLLLSSHQAPLSSQLQHL